MSDYLKRAATTLDTPQSEPIPGSTQVANSAGGYTWQINSLGKLRRFLILGSEGGSYYAGERDLTRQNLDGVKQAFEEHGPEAVRLIVQVSTEGLAAKNDTAIYTLALACSDPRDDVRKAALDAIPAVCRTGTHILTFVSYVDTMRGWGRGLRTAVAAWYDDQTADDLAYQLVKYRNRSGWTHRDVLRSAHPTTHKALYDWVSGREGESLPAIVGAFQKAQESPTAALTAALIRANPSLPREALQTDHLSDPDVWRAMLDQHMPMTALIRNLPTLTRHGIIKPLGADNQKIIAQLTDETQLRKSRIHPLNVLTAALTYAGGHSLRGSTTWTPEPQITDALDRAFDLSFQNVEPTGKRFVLALDVSGSMTWTDINGVPGLQPRLASAAMCLATARAGDPYHVIAFASGIMPVGITAHDTLGSAVQKVAQLPATGTDCALPMLWALQTNVEADAFVVYTDSETWFGNIHPTQALAKYRKETGIDAKLIVVGMVANDFTIADPSDAGMLDVVGFDVSAPRIIADFAAGRI